MKDQQKKLIIEIMNDDAKDGLYKQQTAVEWLISELRESKDFHRVINELNQRGSTVRHILNEAKEMEKQQIENAFRIGATTELTFGDNKAEQYYIKEYGGEL